MASLTSQESSTKSKRAGSFLRSFLERRVHSLTGLFILLFLFEHLLTNSQAALWIGDDGIGFVRMVNLIHSLPYLPVIEWVLLGFPILIHSLLGIRYLKEAHYNSLLGSKKGHKPHFEYPRSKAYTLQRITAWFLLVAVLGHVVHLRILRDPEPVHLASETRYLVSLSLDKGLDTVLDRLGARIVNPLDEWQPADPADSMGQQNQREESLKKYRAKIASLQKSERSVVAASNFGTAMLLVLRDVFKNVGVCLVYSLFVLAAVYHAANGFWTALISWGVTPSLKSQNTMRRVSQVMMGTLAFLGLSAIWLSYWVNLID